MVGRSPKLRKVVRRWGGFRLALAFLLIAALLAGLISVTGWNRRHAERRHVAVASAKSYADLVAANYTILTAKQTSRLFAFANDLRACITKRGIRLGTPKPLNTKIELSIPPEADRDRLPRLGVSCGDALGGPHPARRFKRFKRSETIMRWCCTCPSNV